MLSAILSFFGGTAFRYLLGEVSAFWTKWQDHKFELQRLDKQEEIDAAQHARNLEAQRLQHQMGVEVIRVQGETDLARVDADIFGKAVELTGKSSGNWFVDAWNGAIRPALATECMILWSLHLYRHQWTLDDQGWAIVGGALGIFIADRQLLKRGK